MILVTVVINTYNRKENLIKAIESVRQQEADFNIEIIVVDDCSTDGTDILDYQGFNVKYYRNKSNIGLAKSRQIGLELAENEFVSFLDDDDFFIDKKKLSIQVGVLENNDNLAVVCSNIYEVSDDSPDKKIKEISWPKDIYKHFLIRNGVIYPSTTLIRKSVFFKVGGFDSRFKRGIDSDVYRRVLLHGYEICHVRKPMVCYRVSGSDKITDYKTLNGVRNDLNSNVLTLIKYYPSYLTSPVQLIRKKISIIKKCFYYFKLKISIII